MSASSAQASGTISRGNFRFAGNFHVRFAGDECADRCAQVGVVFGDENSQAL